MDGPALREMRQGFGWSQERLAEAINVDVSTISRWERNATRPGMVNATRVTRILGSKINGAANRAGAYGQAMLPSEFMTQVRYHAGERTILYGKAAIILAYSDFKLARWGMLRATIGLSLLDFLFPHQYPLRDWTLNNFDTFMSNRSRYMVRVKLSDGLTLVPAFGVKQIGTVTFPFPNVLDVVQYDVATSVFDATPDHEIIEL